MRLDGDDLLLEVDFNRMISELVAVRSDIAKVLNVVEIDENGLPLKFSRFPSSSLPLSDFGDSCPLAAGALLRREWWQNLGGYRSSQGKKEDLDFWLRLAQVFDISVETFEFGTYIYRKYRGSMSDSSHERVLAIREVKARIVAETQSTLLCNVFIWVDQNYPEHLTRQTILNVLESNIDEKPIIYQHRSSSFVLSDLIDSGQIVTVADGKIFDLNSKLMSSIRNLSIEGCTLVAHGDMPLPQAHYKDCINSLKLYGRSLVISGVRDAHRHWEMNFSKTSFIGYDGLMTNRMQRSNVYREIGGAYAVLNQSSSQLARLDTSQLLIAEVSEKEIAYIYGQN